MADGVFGQVYDIVGGVNGMVGSRLSEAIAAANSARSTAEGALAALSGVDLDLSMAGDAPAAPTIELATVRSFDLPSLGTASFGTIDPSVTPAPSLGTLPTLADVDIAPFVPSVSNLSIPLPPESSAPETAPERPVLDTVTLPTAPVLDKPLFPSLAAITIPTFTFPNLPTFDATAPEFEGTPVSTVLQWSDPQYATEILDEMLEKVRSIWTGGLGIPAAVEQALWERAASREDLTIARDISAATTEFSARGFTMPPGMLVARIDAIREEGEIKKLALSREVAIKVADTQIENLRFAVEQSVAAENVLFNIWNNIAARQFDAAKIELDSQLALYNAQVAVFNARMGAYGTEAQVYKTKLEGELARIEVFKAELEGELARGTLNEQRVRIYAEQIRALLTDIEIYKAQMDGAKVQSDVIRSQIEIYKADVQAYAERINSDKVRFEAYEAQVRGEAAKAGILDAEARAYAAYVQGKATISEIDVKRVDASIESNRLVLAQYQARLEADKARMSAQAQAVDANARAHIANTQRYTAKVGAEEAHARLGVAATEANMRTNIELYKAEIQKYVADMEQLIRRAGIQVEAMKSTAQVAATMAAGAMAGVSIGAQVSGSGNITGSGQESSSISVSKAQSTANQWTYNERVESDAKQPAFAMAPLS